MVTQVARVGAESICSIFASGSSSESGSFDSGVASSEPVLVSESESESNRSGSGLMMVMVENNAIVAARARCLDVDLRLALSCFER